MNYLFITSLYLSLASDVSIDINFPKSNSEGTHVTIEAGGKEANVVINDYSNPEYGMGAYQVDINTEDGNPKTGEMEIAVDTFTTEGYTANSVVVSDSTGNYIGADYYSAVTKDGKNKTNTTDYVDVYSHNASSNVTTYDYVTVDNYNQKNANGSATQTVIEAQVGEMGYKEEAQTNVDNGSEKGSGEGSYDFWVNSRSSEIEVLRFGGVIVLLIAFMALGVMGCIKIRKSDKKFEERIPIEESYNYFRI